MLGCTPQAYKPYSFLASRPKKEPGDSDRDVNGLLGKGPYKSSAKGPEVTRPLWIASKTWQPSSLLGEKSATVYRGSYVRLASQVAQW